MNRLFTALLTAGVVVALAGCVSSLSQSRSRGLEEIVSCQFDSKTAQEMITSYYSDYYDLRSIYLEKVELEIARRFDDEAPFNYDYAKSFYRPKGTFSIFGAKVHGVLFFSMHGFRFLSVLAEGEIEEVKSRMESHAGLNFVASDSPDEPSYDALAKLYKNGFSFGSINFDQRVSTRSVIQVSKKTPSFFIIGCGFGTRHGPHGQ